MTARTLLMLAAAGVALTAVAAAQELETVIHPKLETAPERRGALPSADAIRAAIRDTIAERPENPRLHEADTLRSTQYELFSRHADEGTVPDCLHADGLKRQPTFFLSGMLALPFIAVAKIRGVCK